MVAYINR